MGIFASIVVWNLAFFAMKVNGTLGCRHGVWFLEPRVAPLYSMLWYAVWFGIGILAYTNASKIDLDGKLKLYSNDESLDDP